MARLEVAMVKKSSDPSSFQSVLKPLQLFFRPLGPIDCRIDGQTDGWTENLPILQDFDPYRGRCPKIMFIVYFESKSGSDQLTHRMSLPNMARLAVAIVALFSVFSIGVSIY